MKKIEKIIVHDGPFHADDVMCVALARAQNPDVVWERLPAAPKTWRPGTIVCDLERGDYDHHGEGVGLDKDGNERASCGLLLADLWEDLFPDYGSYRNFESTYIIPIERQDNGHGRNPLSCAIANFNPNWDSIETFDEAFVKALEFTEGIVSRDMEWCRLEKAAQEKVKKSFEESDGNIVVLDAYVPWKRTLSGTTAKYAVFPSVRGKGDGWIVQTVQHRTPKGKNRSHTAPDRPEKNLLPKEWLEKKPDKCGFVHDNLFLAGFATREAAVAALRG